MITRCPWQWGLYWLRHAHSGVMTCVIHSPWVPSRPRDLAFYMPCHPHAHVLTSIKLSIFSMLQVEQLCTKTIKLRCIASGQLLLLCPNEMLTTHCHWSKSVCLSSLYVCCLYIIRLLPIVCCWCMARALVWFAVTVQVANMLLCAVLLV